MKDFEFYVYWLKTIFKKKYFVSAEIEFKDDKNITHYEVIVLVPFYVSITVETIKRFIIKEHSDVSIERVEILCISKL